MRCVGLFFTMDDYEFWGRTEMVGVRQEMHLMIWNLTWLTGKAPFLSTVVQLPLMSESKQWFCSWSAKADVLGTRPRDSRVLLGLNPAVYSGGY